MLTCLIVKIEQIIWTVASLCWFIEHLRSIDHDRDRIIDEFVKNTSYSSIQFELFRMNFIEGIELTQFYLSFQSQQNLLEVYRNIKHFLHHMPCWLNESSF